MRILVDTVCNPKAVRIVTTTIALLSVLVHYVLPDAVGPETRMQIRYFFLGLMVVWAIIYHAIPKQETPEQRQRRVRGMVWVLLMVGLAVLGTQLYDYFVFKPKVKALMERYRGR